MNSMIEYGPSKLVDHINSLSEFKIHTQIDGNYGHVGAALADAVLQSNNNYERNVRHRVARIRSNYGNYVSLGDLRQLLLTITAQEFLNWTGIRKTKTFLDLVNLLEEERVDTEDDMKSWLMLPNTRDKLLTIRFIGPKTVDYMQILVGLPVAAIDRHLLNFLAEAGLNKPDYYLGQDIIHRAADLMAINRSHLDHSIWRYMSGRGRPPGPSGSFDCRPRVLRKCAV